MPPRHKSPLVALVLLCHKVLVLFSDMCVRMEILTRGGGLWVSKPKRAAANHGSLPMSRRLRRRWGTPIARLPSNRIARVCCYPATARVSSRWLRACSRRGCRQHISRSITSWQNPTGRTTLCWQRCARARPAHHQAAWPDPRAHHRRHRHAEERQALRRRGAAVLWAAW